MKYPNKSTQLTGKKTGATKDYKISLSTTNNQLIVKNVREDEKDLKTKEDSKDHINRKNTYEGKYKAGPKLRIKKSFMFDYSGVFNGILIKYVGGDLESFEKLLGDIKAFKNAFFCSTQASPLFCALTLPQATQTRTSQIDISIFCYMARICLNFENDHNWINEFIIHNKFLNYFTEVNYSDFMNQDWIMKWSYSSSDLQLYIVSLERSLNIRKTLSPLFSMKPLSIKKILSINILKDAHSNIFKAGVTPAFRSNSENLNLELSYDIDGISGFMCVQDAYKILTATL